MSLSKSRLLYFIVIFIIFVIIVSISNFCGLNDDYEKPALIILLLAWVLLHAYISIQSNNKTERILTHQCDPEAYIEKIIRLMNDRSAKKNGRYMLIKRLQLCNGLRASGKFEQMEAELPWQPVKPNTLANRLIALFHASLVLSVYLRHGDTEKAYAMIANIRGLLNNKRLTRKSFSVYESNIKYYNALIDMKCGMFGSVIEQLTHCFNSSDVPYTRASTQYYLGKAYLHFNQLEQARAAFQYTIDNGNKLYVVKLAREALTAITV